MKLVHFSDQPIDKLEEREYPQFDLKWQAKPNGFWVSDEDSKGWKEWCESEKFRLDFLTIAYEIIISENSNILILQSPEQIFEFTKKYPFKTRYFDSEHDTYQLDWNKVKSKYQGIIITPYQWDCRLALETSWYYGWDCASGCLWDLKCVKEFKRIN